MLYQMGREPSWLASIAQFSRGVYSQIYFSNDADIVIIHIHCFPIRYYQTKINPVIPLSNS